MTIQGGIPTIRQYHDVFELDTFKSIEDFSDKFIERNRKILSKYAKRWILDSFHTYNRQWEYPYVFDQIKHYANNNLAQDIRILDAGSGITFFPFFIHQSLSNAAITCCDQNRSFEKIFNQLTEKEGDVTFEIDHLHALKYPKNTFDIVYCISVLEHTNAYEQIINEINRVLKPGGRLIITFDISIDGCADIPIDTAKKLLSHLEKYFKNTGEYKDLPAKSFLNENALSTKYIKTYKRELLPWKHPFLSVLKSALNRKCFPKSLMKNLTFYCGTYQKY